MHTVNGDVGAPIRLNDAKLQNYYGNVSVRLLFINEHREIDRVELPSSGAKVYGRPGNPLRLELSELNGPPPGAQCRIRPDNGVWYLENTGIEGQTFLNNQPTHGLVALPDWAQIRCGTQVVCFEYSRGRAVSADLQRSRDDLAKAQAGAAEAQQALATCVSEKLALEQKYLATEAARGQRSDSEAALRLQVKNLEHKCDALSERLEREQRQHGAQCGELAAEKERYAEKLQRAAEKLQQLGREHNEARASSQASAAKVVDAELAVRSLKQQLLEARQLLEQLDNQRTALHAEHKELTHENSRLARIAEAAARTAREARQSRAEVEKEIRELRELHDKHLAEQKHRDALQLQAARARRELADCQAKLRKLQAETEASDPQLSALTTPETGVVSELVRQAIKALDRAVLDANYAALSCEERWSRAGESLTNLHHRQELLRELHQLSGVTSHACAFLDQLHRLLPAT